MTQTFLKGIEQFNAQEFFQCHETLESLWIIDQSERRQLLQGIIQIAVGYYHYLRANRTGALRLLSRGLERIKIYEIFEPDNLGLNIAKFTADVSASMEEIANWSGDLPVNPSIKLPTIEFLRD